MTLPTPRCVMSPEAGPHSESTSKKSCTLAVESPMKPGVPSPPACASAFDHV